MRVEISYPDPAAMAKGQTVMKALTIQADYVPDTGDLIDLGNGGAMQATDRRFVVVRGVLEARLKLR